MTIELGRNIEQDTQTYRYVIKAKFDGRMLDYWFDTKRQATLKFNKLRKSGASYFDPKEDPTI